MRKALLNVVRLYEPAHATWIQALLERVERMPRATRLFARMASAPEKQQLDDYLAEAVYALVFAGLGFTVTVEPFGREGPDLEVSRGGHRAVVEVSRFRNIYAGPLTFDTSHDPEDAELSQYGDPRRDINKSFEKLRANCLKWATSQPLLPCGMTIETWLNGKWRRRLLCFAEAPSGAS